MAKIPDKPLLLSHLDNLRRGWILDAKDWVHFFTKIVSPELSKRFEEMVKKSVFGANVPVYAGPPKTYTRTMAKCNEYYSEFKERRSARFLNFSKQFEKVFQRVPCSPEDFVWNVVDFARCSIEVPSAQGLIEVKRLLEKHFSVVCVKNGYKKDMSVKGSGYRDLKLLVLAEFDGLELGNIPQIQTKISMICEIQILCQTWLSNKKTTSFSYKVLRAKTLNSLLRDMAKYLLVSDGVELLKGFDPLDALKHGWVNLARGIDFSNLDINKLMWRAASEG